MSTTPVDKAAELSAKLDKMRDTLATVADADKTARKGLAPAVRRGENSLTSRGYSFGKLFALMGKRCSPEDARVEVDMHNDLKKALYDTYGGVPTEPNTILAPFATEFLPVNSESERKFAMQVRTRVKAGLSGFDPQEFASTLRRVNKTLSWQDEQALGALVAPPQFGELIEVLRNNEVLLKAGASTIGMPPNGRIVYPRQTGAATAYHIGENVALTSSEPQTGDVILQAKKLACLVKAPNELFRFASVSVEAFLRMDMAKVIALKLDKQLIEGVGSSVAPKGLINYSNITSHTSTGTPADGNSGYPLQPEDVYQMIAKVEEQNAQFKSWVMRPLLWAYLVNRRADAVTANDKRGPFMFNVWRELGDQQNVDRDSVGTLAGYPVHKSTQISNTRTRGSGTTNNSYILAGDFSDYMIAMSPTVEFAMTQQSDTAFQNDQTWLRAILSYDGAPRREASFLLCDQLLTS